MKHLMSILAVVLFTFAIAGCASESVCDQYCDKVDECTGTDNAESCKETYAASMSANADVTTEACQAALDATEDACGSDDDDSAS